MKKLLMAGVAAAAMLVGGSAMARVDVDISIGGPAVIYSEPEYYYPPPRYERPRVIILPERVYRQHPGYKTRYYRQAYHGDHRQYKRQHKNHNNRYHNHHHRRGGR